MERRSRSKSSAKAKADDVDDTPEINDGSSTSSSDDSEVEDVPPKPVSSDSENDAEDEDSSSNTTTEQVASKTCASGMSRLFAPYRTLGVVTSGRPFHLIPHENSQSAMICLPIGDRFQLMQTDRLHPVLVSHAVPSSYSSSRKHVKKQKKKTPQEISHCVTDASLSITVVAHGQPRSPDSVTLYHRTRPLQTQSVMNRRMMKQGDDWSIQSLLHVGRIKMEMKGEKEGRKENAAVIVVVLSKTQDDGVEHKDKVPVVGDDDDSSDDDDDDDDDDSGDLSSVQEEEKECLGQVVVLLATRTTLQMHRRIPLTTLKTFRPLTAMHPATYLNKVVLAGVDQGIPTMCLVNVRSSKVIHTFKCLPKGTEGKVLTVVQAPAVDTVAVGTDRGMVHLVNLRHDKVLFSLRHKSSAGQTVAITSISFRTDGSAMRYGIAPMAVGRLDGTITVWDLTPPEDGDAGRTILCEMERVHGGGVSKLQYLPQEPLLLSIGTRSNAVLMHIFDNPNHSGRVLRQRKGHTAPPSRIRYIRSGTGTGGGVFVNDGTDAATCQILSSGGPDRSLRVFSTARSVLDKEYSQGKGLEKRAKKLGMESTVELLLPPVKSMALSDCRSRDWGDLVTIHENHSFAYVWSTKRGAQSGPILRQTNWNVSAMKVPPPPRTHATSVTMSACGNFAVVGDRGGSIYKYNVQSGLPRGSYPRDVGDSEAESRHTKPVAGDIKRTMKALEKNMKISNRQSNLDKQDVDAEHEARVEQRRLLMLQRASHTGFAVTGLAVDSVNKTLVSVGADGKLILWNFNTHAPHKKSPCTLPCAATRLCHIRESDLAAIALEDFSVVLFDCTSLMIVRRFGVEGSKVNHTAPITDLGFSPDGRTLFTSSLDGTIRVFDVPTNSCVDWLRFSTVPTSLAISPTGEFLATTHSGRLGISIWSDKSYYQTVHVDGTPLLQPAQMDEPVPMSDAQGTHERKKAPPAVQPNKAADDDNDDGDDKKIAPEPKGKGLVTMSGLPPVHWKNLFHLELVKERNRPKEPPKKPPTAPFFLQWRSGEALGETPAIESEKTNQIGQDDEEWAAAWSDDDGGGGVEEEAAVSQDKVDAKRGVPDDRQLDRKRRKVTHYRSHLASLLQQCGSRKVSSGQSRFQEVTDYVASLGPSAIDISLSSLCNGTHDVEEGLPLLLLACEWLVEACQSRERFEVINAYLHRFLHVHASLITEVDKGLQAASGDAHGLLSESEQTKQLQLIESLSRLKGAQQDASAALDEKMKQTTCLLRHFSRMV